VTQRGCLQAAFASALLDPTRPIPSGLRTWNGSDPEVRFAVYRNNVTCGLVNALADSFPVVQALVGEAFFSAMARTFIHDEPPASPVIAFYGSGFPDFVESFAPARALPYLADVARLEFARIRAYHAVDATVIDSATPPQVLQLGERLRDLRIELHPSVVPWVYGHPAVSIWRAHQADDVALEDIDMARVEAAIVLRQALDVVVVPVPRATAELAQAFARERPLGAAVDELTTRDSEFDLFQSLGTLFRYPMVHALHLPPEI